MVVHDFYSTSTDPLPKVEADLLTNQEDEKWKNMYAHLAVTFMTRQ